MCWGFYVGNPCNFLFFSNALSKSKISIEIYMFLKQQYKQMGLSNKCLYLPHPLVRHLLKITWRFVFDIPKILRQTHVSNCLFTYISHEFPLFPSTSYIFYFWLKLLYPHVWGRSMNSTYHILVFSHFSEWFPLKSQCTADCSVSWTNSPVNR